MQDPLAALRPLHMPPPISWWPPAPGWWLLLLLFLVSAILLLYRWRRMAPRRAALRELATLAAQPAPPAAALNRLLKRYALVCWPTRDIAALSGEAWLHFLDANGGKGAFQHGPGRALLYAPYSAGTLPAGGLVALCRRWIKTNRPRRSG